MRPSDTGGARGADVRGTRGDDLWGPLALALALCLSGLYLFSTDSLARLAGGMPTDTDGILHAMRVRDWFAGLDPDFAARDNGPYGYYMHWTRPYDVFAGGLVLLLRPFLPSDAAMLWGTGISGAASYVLLIAVMVHSARSIGGRPGAWLSGPILCSGLGLYAYSQIGRNDHHVLLLVPVAAAFGLLWRERGRAAEGQGRPRRSGFLAGLCCAGAMWVSVEPLDLVLLAFAAFSLERAEGRLGRGGLAALGAGFLFGTAAALALDPPKPDAFEAQTDRLSVVFLSLSFLLACACAAADRFSSASERREAGSSSRWIRAAAVGLPLLAALAAWVLLFPKIAGGAEAVVGKFLAERWWSGILEIRPLSTATEYVVFVSLAFAALPAALERAARDTETDAEIGAGRRGRSLRWLLWGVACLGAIGLAVSHLRFTTHAEFIAALALFECVPRWAWAGRGEDLPGTGLRRPLLLAVFPCAAFLAVMAAGLFGASEPAGGSADASGAQAKEHAAEAAPKPKGPCDLRQTAPWLDKALPVPEVLMTTIMDAPTLQFLTRHSSVAGPYQRNRAGLEDLYAFYLSVGDDAKAKAMLAKRGIRHVLSCPGQYSNTLENLPGETGENLHSRLAGGGTPEWLEEEAWPEGTPATGYRLLRVSDRKH